jgi:hypothetical protein
VGRSYDVVIAAVGPRVNIWMDGIPVAEFEDSALTHGRIGLYCWANIGAEFSSVRVFSPDRLSPVDLLSEDFDFEPPGRWTYLTAGTEQLPAAWTITGGELRQSSNVWGGDGTPGELLKPGTSAIFTQPAGLGSTGLIPGSESWTDYRVSVRLRSDDDDTIGVLVRYRDEDNWYRFSMDRERAYRRLIRCEGGVVTDLWHDSVPYEVGAEYLITLDVIGDTIVGYLNGISLFSVRDSTHATGTIGLYCWANTGARFPSVRVCAASWSTYYRFSLDEAELTAGTRVAVHSGNASDWDQPPKPGLTHRFSALAQDPGRRRLPLNRSVDFRWRNRVGELGHERRFLPASLYVAVPSATALRKADGTEAAIFVPASGLLASALTEGQYRLHLTYRRDNTAAEAGSTILSRTGDSSDEVAVLDVPWNF